MTTSLADAASTQCLQVQEEETKDVRWLASGDAVCSVSLASCTSVGEVKAQVEERIGIPVKEQRLFVKDQELPNGTPVSSRASGESLQLVRTSTDPLDTDLGYFHAAVTSCDIEPLPIDAFTKVGKAGFGLGGVVSTYRRRHLDGVEQEVAVKVYSAKQLASLEHTERDERRAHLRLGDRRAPKGGDDPLTEAGVMRQLAAHPELPLYLLRLEGLYACPSGDMWLVTEFCKGGELFDEVQRVGALPPVQANDYMWQLLQAVAYLHHLRIAHRDISLENILLQDGSLRLMDFGMAVRSETEAGTALRYFRPVGKDNYRSPEMYVPEEPEVFVHVPAEAAPGEVICTVVRNAFICEVRLPAHAVPGGTCLAEVFGYAAAPADIWSTATCLVTMLLGGPAWRLAVPGDDLFSYVREHGLAKLLAAWRKPPLAPQVQALLDAMLGARPGLRPTAAACLASGWFEAKRHAAVPCHPQAGTSGAAIEQHAVAGGA